MATMAQRVRCLGGNVHSRHGRTRPVPTASRLKHRSPLRLPVRRGLAATAGSVAPGTVFAGSRRDQNDIVNNPAAPSCMLQAMIRSPGQVGRASRMAALRHPNLDHRYIRAELVGPGAPSPVNAEVCANLLRNPSMTGELAGLIVGQLGHAHRLLAEMGTHAAGVRYAQRWAAVAALLISRFPDADGVPPLAGMHTCDNMLLRAGAAGSSRCPPEVLRWLQQDPEPLVWVLAVCNRNRPPGSPVYNGPAAPEHVMGLLAWASRLSRRCPPEVLVRLGTQPQTGIAMAAARHPNCPPGLLGTMVRGDNHELAVAAAGHSRCPQSALAAASWCSGYQLRMAAAGNPACPQLALRRLLADPVRSVAMAAARNPSLPREDRIMWRLANAC